MTASTPKRALRFSRTHFIVITVFVLTLIAIAVGVAIPSNMTNGTERYKGAELEAAQFILEHDRAQELSAKIMKPQIQSVTPSPQGVGSTGKPLRCTDDPQDMDYYTVVIKHVSLFGITYDTREYNICKLFGWPN